ncbi:MAG: PAS domain S-box protein [Burkholderiaceae bacterium]|nr:PAS domain S-box protein [Burkholderiaceae bacterium]
MNLYDFAAMPDQPLSRHYMRKYGLTYLAVAILFLALIASQMYASYLVAQEFATTDAKNLALVLESKLSIDFEAAQSAVSAMAIEISPDAMRQEAARGYRAQITQRLKSRVRNIKSASALRYFDANGDLLYSSLDSDFPFSIADRPFFQQLRNDPAYTIIFSEVIIGRTINRALMAVDKAIRDKDGSFLGVATTAIDLKSLHDDFSNIELGKEGAVVLRRLENGAIVVRHPGPVNVDNAPYPNIPIRQAILKDGPTGAIGFMSPVDGIRRIYGYRTVGSFPFFVAVGISESAYLGEWRRNSITTLLASVLFLAILAAVFTRLARAESQRHRNEERLAEIFFAISEGLIFQNKDGIIIDVNPAAEQLLSLSRNELLGMSCMDSRWPVVRDDGTRFLGHQHPAMVALRTGQPVRNQIMGIVAPGRGLRWMSISSNPIFGQGKAAPDTVVTTFSDVTERKQAETDLRIAATAFQSQEGMMVTDNKGVILRVNRVFTEITGYTAEEVVGQTPRLLQSGHHDAYFYRKMWNSILRTGGWQGEIWDRRKNGEVYPKWLTISAVKDDVGAITHFVGTHSDITGRKNADAAMHNLNRDLSESRQRLRGLAAQNEARLEGERKHIAQEVHDELGQVLTALRMDLSLLGMRFGPLDPAVNDKVLDMKRLVDRAILGVRNVAVNLRPTALDMGLAPAIEWLCNEFTRLTTISCVLDAGEENIDLDETRAVVIFRIVQESLTNITRYAHASQVEITLGLRGRELGLEVRDNGCGFDRAAVAKRKSFGLLGMRERALALGGRVDIISAPGKGTVIGVSIPIDFDTAKENP